MDATEYHERTTHSPRSVRESDVTLDRTNRPRPYKAYADLPREPLPGFRAPMQPALSAVAEARRSPLSDAEQSAQQAPDREALAALCYEASGIVQQVEQQGQTLRFRAASCTGKLYHVDCYLVCGDLPDLPAGIYHFDPDGFKLDVVREGDYRGVLAEAVGEPATGNKRGDTGVADAPATGVADAPVTVVATSTWWRNAWKYRERTYRHAFWDSGTVLANLLATAHALDLPASVVAGFADDDVATLIGVDPEREAPIALAPIGIGDPVTDSPSVDPIDPETEPLSDRIVDYPPIYEAWAESRLADGAAAAEWRERCRSAGSIGSAESGDGERVPLDPVDHETESHRPLHATVRRRGSKREFAETGPSRRKVGTVLDRSVRGVPADWNEGGRPDQGGGSAEGLQYNDVFVLATGIDGVPDGSYQYHPEEAALERLGDASRETKTHLALDQGWGGDAHANVYLLADVDAAVETLENRGYRVAQLEAGITLGRLYLAAYAHRDLGGTGLTFYDDLVTEQFSPRADGLTPTCLFAFGRLPS